MSILDEGSVSLLSTFQDVAVRAYTMAGVQVDGNVIAARVCEMYVLFMVGAVAGGNAGKASAAILSLVKPPK